MKNITQNNQFNSGKLPLTQNFEETERFLNTLEPGGSFTFQTFSDSVANKDPGLVCVLNGTFDEHRDELCRLNNLGAGVFVTVNQTDGMGRKKANIIGVRAIFVDLDGAPLKNIIEFPLRAHIIVNSSARRYHAYWLVEELPLDEFETIQKAIIKTFDGDKSVKDLPRVMRLPGFIWHKVGQDGKPKGPAYVSKLVNIYNAPAYTTETIHQHLNISSCATRSKPGVHIPGTAMDSILEALQDKGLVKGPTSGKTGAYDILCPWRDTHTTGDGGTIYFQPHHNGYKGPAFKCQHSHCADKTVKEVKEFLGIKVEESPRLRLNNRSYSDLGNAERFASRHQGKIHYVTEPRQWIVWKENRWSTVNDHVIIAMAGEVAKGIEEEARISEDSDQRSEALRFALASQNRGALRAMVDLAISQPGIAVSQALLDANPMYLGVENGVVDLTAGKLVPNTPEYMITKYTRVSYDDVAQCPRWMEFLNTVFAGNQALIDYIQTAIGYSLTGKTEEQILFMLYGSGANGKTVFIEILRRLLSDHARAMAADTLMSTSSNRQSNDIARLAGARLVTVSEINEGKRLDEERIKKLTGGDTVNARFLYCEDFEFPPQFKVWICTNHKPAAGDGHAMWRRIKLIPFNVTISKDQQDRDLPAKLTVELPGILNWAMQGCLKYQQEGLIEPTCVKDATDDYQREMDRLQQWLDDMCSVGPTEHVRAGNLYDSYKIYTNDNGGRPLSSRKFFNKLTERGFTKSRDSGGITYHGLSLHEQPSVVDSQSKQHINCVMTFRDRLELNRARAHEV